MPWAKLVGIQSPSYFGKQLPGILHPIAHRLTSRLYLLSRLRVLARNPTHINVGR